VCWQFYSCWPRRCELLQHMCLHMDCAVRLATWCCMRNILLSVAFPSTVLLTSPMVFTDHPELSSY
jgi:hypothetical protein